MPVPYVFGRAQIDAHQWAPAFASCICICIGAGAGVLVTIVRAPPKPHRPFRIARWAFLSRPLEQLLNDEKPVDLDIEREKDDLRQGLGAANTPRSITRRC